MCFPFFKLTMLNTTASSHSYFLKNKSKTKEKNKSCISFLAPLNSPSSTSFFNSTQLFSLPFILTLFFRRRRLQTTTFFFIQTQQPPRNTNLPYSFPSRNFRPNFPPHNKTRPLPLLLNLHLSFYHHIITRSSSSFNTKLMSTSHSLQFWKITSSPSSSFLRQPPVTLIATTSPFSLTHMQRKKRKQVLLIFYLDPETL